MLRKKQRRVRVNKIHQKIVYARKLLGFLWVDSSPTLTPETLFLPLLEMFFTVCFCQGLWVLLPQRLCARTLFHWRLREKINLGLWKHGRQCRNHQNHVRQNLLFWRRISFMGVFKFCYPIFLSRHFCSEVLRLLVVRWGFWKVLCFV